jgi:Na+/proline symporter
MRPLDWAVLGTSLIFILLYGLWRGRGSDTTSKYLLAGRTMPWYAMALSIMATQASAITFISTTGQAYVDGMRFVQFYFGLPLGMVLLAVTAVPIFHRANVYTAYEYLEQRFDIKTRVLGTVLFLIGRGISAGIALYAPALVLTVVLGWSDKLTSLGMGILVITYTVFGGIKAVTWTDFQQMLIMMLGLVAALVLAVWFLPADISFVDALEIAGAAGRLNPVVWNFSLSDTYNVWSGFLGGLFIALAYFGTDQSQVQRYLTGKSIAQSRISLLFNGVAKVPMQFLILFTGAMVFVFYTFVQPPMLFERRDLEKARTAPGFAQVETRYNAAFDARHKAAREVAHEYSSAAVARFKLAQQDFDAARVEAARLTGAARPTDANYIFLSFVTTWLPAGVVGLILAAIFAAAMSTISAEVNSLATVTVIDVYQRCVRRGASDRHYLNASRLATLFWGGWAVLASQLGAGPAALIETVNRYGSLFYGGMLGLFTLAFFFRRVGGTAAFIAVLTGEAAIFATLAFTDIFFLWYNVIGAVVTVLTGLLLSRANLHADGRSAPASA